MKINRLLSIVIVICLSLGTVVQAADSTLVIRENVIFDLQSYGILQGKENGDLALDDNVTRAEFTAFVGRLIRAVNISYTERFKDVNKDDWFAQDVLNLAAYGLIEGNENGEFCPNDNVTYTDAMKILVCALGYRVAAEKSGAYPDGYLSVGTKIKLNDGISAGREDFLTRGAVVLMLYNALDIEILEPVSYDPDSPTYELSGKTFRSLFSLDTNKDSVYMSTGIVTADYYSYLLEPVAEIEPGQVQINSIIYNVGTTNTDKLLGQEVEYYYRENKHGAPTIISSRVSDTNKTLVLEPENIGDVYSDSLNYYDNEKGKDVQIKLSSSFSVIKNYQLMSKPYSFVTGEDICKNGSVKLTDNTGDGYYDLAIVEDYKSYRVGRVSEKGFVLANDKVFDGKNFIKLTDDEEDVKIILVNSAGEDISLADIMENDVVSLLQSEDKSVLKCVKGSSAVSGVLSESAEDTIYIDGTAYSYDYYFASDIRLGRGVIAYLDFNGDIIELELDKSSSKTYAYILESGSAQGLSGAFSLKVLIPGKLKTQIEIDDSDEDQIVEIPVLKAYNNSIEVLTLSEKISFDGVRMTESEYSILFSSSSLSSSPENRLISYRTNSEGIVTSIESAERIGDGNYKVYNGYENVFGKEGTEAFGISETSAVVCIPEEIPAGFNEENYYASILMNNGQRYKITGFDIDSETSIADIVVVTAPMDLQSGDVITSSSKLAVVSKISTVVDEADEEIKTKIEFWSESKKMTYFVAPDSEASRISASMNFGDIFYYALNNVDEIYKISKCDLGNLGGELILGDRGSNDTERSILGEVTDIDYNIIDLYENRRVNRLTVSFDERVSPLSLDVNRRNTPPIYLIDTRTSEVKPGSLDDIYVGGDTIFAHIKEYSVKGIVLIR